jgi:hypothetical protein
MMRNRPLLPIMLTALTVLVLSVLVIVASVRGTGLGEFGFAEVAPADLPAEAEIAGWAVFDKDSYLPGEIATCTIRILWRRDVVTPDFESFQSSVSFYPLDHEAGPVIERNLSGGIREYVAEFLLQAVNVDSTESYLLSTATIYYTNKRVTSGELQALRINPPQFHVGELYPQDISDISLRAPKPAISEPTLLRQWLITLFALALIGLVVNIVWRYGRRRPLSKLSEAERLWYEFDRLQSDVSGTRQYVLNCERIFMRALFLRAGLSATDFWSGQGLAGSDWQGTTDEARNIFGQCYQPGQPGYEGVNRISTLIKDLLGPLVTEEQLHRELEPSFATRLRHEPRVLATAALLSLSAIALFTLAAMPSSWVSPEVVRYNIAVAMLEDDGNLEHAFAEFSTLGIDAEDKRVKAASLYNQGTLITDPRLSGQSPLQQRELLKAIFLPGITLDRLLHALEIDAEFELLTTLADAARRYVQAEAAMKAAVRINPDDTDIRRNLEILGKTRRALANTLAQLVDEGERSAGLVEMQQQTIIDLKRLMEVEMPEDFARLEEGKDDTNYFILEQF